MKKTLNVRSTPQWREYQFNVWMFIVIAIIAGIAVLTTVANAEEPQPGPAPATVAQDESAHSSISPAISEALVQTKRETIKQALAPETTTGTQLAGQLFKGLVYCLAIFFAGVSIYRRYVLPKKEALSDGIEVLARRALGPKTNLFIVRAEGRKFFLSQAGDLVTLLAPIQDAPSFDEEFTRLALNSEDEPKVALAMERR